MSRYTKEEILAKVDHTLLKPEATWPQVQALCDEAMRWHTASVCINTCYVRQAAEYMAGRVPVCCVVGFPLGAMDTASKCFEAKTAVENGAEEVDMVINIGRLKNKEYDAVREDIAAVKKAIGDKVLKVIIETCLLTEEEKIKMCDIVPEAGADFIKTSTGKIEPAATPEAAYVMCTAIKEYFAETGTKIGFKAAGGVSTVDDALTYYTIVREVLGESWIKEGLFRIGTSRLANLLVSDVLGEPVKPF